MHNKFSEKYDNETINYDNDNYYMASDSYEIVKNNIDKKTLFERFSLNEKENGITISYKNGFYFVKYYILARISFSYIDKNNTLVKSNLTVTIANEKETKISFPEYKNVSFIELEVIDGYAYSLTRKENGKNPYIDSNIYL